MTDEGVEVLVQADVLSVTGRSGTGVALQVRSGATKRTLEASDILVAAGRTPNTDQLDAAKAGVELDKRGYVHVKDRLQTTAANVWATGEWFQYEADTLIPYISNGPLISWMYPVFGVRGATWFLSVSEWSFGARMFLGFWNKKLGILGDLGACFSFVGTITIIPFMPDGWAASAGGFPVMTGNVPFLMKDVALLAVSIYLLKQDVARASSPEAERHEWHSVGNSRAWAAEKAAAKLRCRGGRLASAPLRRCGNRHGQPGGRREPFRARCCCQGPSRV